MQDYKVDLDVLLPSLYNCDHECDGYDGRCSLTLMHLRQYKVNMYFPQGKSPDTPYSINGYNRGSAKAARVLCTSLTEPRCFGSITSTCCRWRTKQHYWNNIRVDRISNLRMMAAQEVDGLISPVLRSSCWCFVPTIQRSQHVYKRKIQW
mgnify:CR=1 FL=1